MPSPIETELRVHVSPVPTQTVRGSLGSMVMAPIDCTGCLSNTGLKRVPESWLFHTPPLAAPTYTSVLPSTLRPATADTRPLIVADPMLRAPRPEMTPSSKEAFCAAGGGGASYEVAFASGSA